MKLGLYIDIISKYDKDCLFNESIENDEPIQQGDNYPIEDHVEIRTQIKNTLKPLADRVRNYDKKLIRYSNADMSPEYIERGLSSYIDFGFENPEGLTQEEIDKNYKWSIRFSEHEDKHGKDKNRYYVELEGRTLNDLCRVGWKKFKTKLPKIQKKIRDFEIEKFGEQKTFITDKKPEDLEKSEITDNDTKKENESLKIKIRENHKKGCFSMKLKIREGIEDVYKDGNQFYDMFAVVKEYIKKEFNPSKWNDIIWDFNEIPNDDGWFAEIIFTNGATGQRAKFTCEYKDAYSGLLYATYNYGKETVFYSQKDFVDWLAEQVEWRLY